MRWRWIAVGLGLRLLSHAAPAEAALRVVATIFPLTDIVRQIGRDAVEVVTLLPPGASPHTFEPTPAQMRDVAGARVFVRVGAGLDGWTAKLLAAASADLMVVTATDGIPLLGAGAGEAHGDAAASGDPHVWLDPLLVRDHLVPAIAAALGAAAPAQRAAFDAAAGECRDALTQLDAQIREALAPLPQRGYIAFHAAWRYFGRRYDLREVAVVEGFPGKEPSAREVAAVVDRARAVGVHAVLVEPQFNPRVAEQIAREFGGTARVVDPLGGPGIAGREHYSDLMRYNAQAFAEALR